VTKLLADIMDKAPQTTTVIIEEVPADSWGTGGTSVAAQRAKK
jgi:4-oxalocrotonate tautomerase family enzyme